MVLWAFLTVYLAPANRFLSDAPGFFIGAVLLWMEYRRRTAR